MRYRTRGAFFLEEEAPAAAEDSQSNASCDFEPLEEEGEECDDGEQEKEKAGNGKKRKRQTVAQKEKTVVLDWDHVLKRQRGATLARDQDAAEDSSDPDSEPSSSSAFYSESVAPVGASGRQRDPERTPETPDESEEDEGDGKKERKN